MSDRKELFTMLPDSLALPSQIEREFVCHSAKNGEHILSMMAFAIEEREHTQPCGSDTLPKHLRFAYPDVFSIHNSLVAWYMAALVIVREDLAPRLVVDPNKVQRLRDLGWKLSPKGEPRHE